MKLSRTGQYHQKKQEPYHISEQGNHSYAVSYTFSFDKKGSEAEKGLKCFCDTIAKEIEADGGIVGHIKMICTETTEKQLSYITDELRSDTTHREKTTIKGVAILLTEKGEHIRAVMDHAFAALK